MVKIGHYFHKSFWITLFFLIFQKYYLQHVVLKYLDGVLFFWTLLIFLGLPNYIQHEK